jgi:peroxiredoxin
MMRRTACSALALTLLVAACGRASGVASTASDSSSPAAARAATAENNVPMQKEYAATPVDRVGTLPPGVGIEVGGHVPAVGATDLDGGAVALGDLIARGPILLVFYRGGWCPYCNFEIHELTTTYPEYLKRGVTPVAVSVDKPGEASKTEATYSIPFPVLSDSNLAVHEAFHVVHRADDAEVAKLKGFGIDLETSSGRSHHSFAVPALFLIDRQGVVRWAHADPDDRTRPKTPQILAAIDAAHL